MKGLTPRAHGVLDYVMVVLFAVAPNLFGFSGAAAGVAYGLAAVHLALALSTDFPLGPAKAVPFSVHGGVEVIVAFALVFLPFVSGFGDEPAARNFFLGSGVALVMVWAFTNYHVEFPQHMRRHVIN